MLVKTMSEDDQIEDLFVNEKPCLFLMAVNQGEEPIASDISERIDTTYAYTIRIRKKLESAGLVQRQKHGRRQLLSLTEEGKRATDAIGNLYGTLRDVGGE